LLMGIPESSRYSPFFSGSQQDGTPDPGQLRLGGLIVVKCHGISEISPKTCPIQIGYHGQAIETKTEERADDKNNPPDNLSLILKM